MSQRVAVIGAGGFIGAHIAAAWAERGATVQRIVRTTPAAVAPVDIVINAARAPSEDVRRFVERSNAAGARHFVHISSVAAARPETEYGRLKAEQEAVVTRAAEKAGLSATILRLPAVFGAHMTGMPLRLGRWAARGWPIADVGGRRSVVYVENAAAATIAATSTGGVFVVDDSWVVRPVDYVNLLAAALGRSRVLAVPLPAGVLSIAGAVAGLLPPLRSRGWSRAGMQRFLRDVVADGRQFAAATGYRPPVDRAAAFQRTADWLRNAG